MFYQKSNTNSNAAEVLLALAKAADFQASGKLNQQYSLPKSFQSWSY
jgi:hypothetical protein